jgi:hypothetical protein
MDENETRKFIITKKEGLGILFGIFTFISYINFFLLILSIL